MKTIKTYFILMTILVSCSKESVEIEEEVLKTPYLVTATSGATDSLAYYYNQLQEELLGAQTGSLVATQKYEAIAALCTDTFGEYLWQLPSPVSRDSTEIRFNDILDNSQLSILAKDRMRAMTETLLLAEDFSGLPQLYDSFRGEIENDPLFTSEDKRVLLGTLWFITELNKEVPTPSVLSEGDDDDDDGGGREDEDWNISIGHIYNWLEGDLQSNAQGIHNALILSVANDNE